MSSNSVRVGVVQMTTLGDSFSQNELKVLDFMKLASEEKCDIVSFPENALWLGSRDKNEIDAKRNLKRIAEASKEYDLEVVIGTPNKGIDEQKFSNSLFWIRKGEIIAEYKKLHLFDYGALQESKSTEQGQELVVVHSHGLKFALTICYDLRFPAMFQRYHSEGCDAILVPSAFTKETGQAHWKTLLKARAIENQCYVVASAQVGNHNSVRSSFGESCIVDPWGECVAESDREKEELITHDLSLDVVREIRKKMPIIEHRREVEKLPIKHC